MPRVCQRFAGGSQSCSVGESKERSAKKAKRVEPLRPSLSFDVIVGSEGVLAELCDKAGITTC